MAMLAEFVGLLLARGRLPEVRLVERSAQSYASSEMLLTWLRGQLWVKPDGAKDLELQRIVDDPQRERDGRVSLDWSAVRIGVVTWTPTRVST